MSAVTAGEIVHLDDNQSVMFTVIHVHESMVWIKPYANTQEHNHFSHGGTCMCEREDLVDSSRLWLKTWYSKNPKEIKADEEAEATQLAP